MSTDSKIYSHKTCNLGKVVFSSNFENGNLGNVESVKGYDYTYNVWTASDNYGTQYQTRNCFWFYFSVSGVDVGAKLCIRMMNAGHHSTLYKHDMRPVYKSIATRDKWLRIKSPIKFEKNSEGTIVVFEHIIESNDTTSSNQNASGSSSSTSESTTNNTSRSDTLLSPRSSSNRNTEKNIVYFAFAHPYTYSMLMTDLDPLNTWNTKHNIYCNRECLIYTPDHRRIDLITITAADHLSSSYETEPVFPYLFPDNILTNKKPGTATTTTTTTTSSSNKGHTRPPTAGHKPFSMKSPRSPTYSHSTTTTTTNTHAQIVNDKNSNSISTANTAITSTNIDNSQQYTNTVNSSNVSSSSSDKNMYGDHTIVKSIRPPIFKHKEIIFLSARVHPGEVPAQFTLKGIMDVLLDEKDPRAIELRRRYVFKIIPMLNPDGVYRGHSRMDQYGQNLNRYYIHPDVTLQPSIYAAKTLLDYYTSQHLLFMYIDLHAHSSKLGSFIFGNVLDNIWDQIQNQLYCQLIALNTKYFNYDACLFSREHMCRIDPGDRSKGLTAEGSGRVYNYIKHGLIHSYTLECNYNTYRTATTKSTTTGTTNATTTAAAATTTTTTTTTTTLDNNTINNSSSKSIQTIDNTVDNSNISNTTTTTSTTTTKSTTAKSTSSSSSSTSNSTLTSPEVYQIIGKSCLYSLLDMYQCNSLSKLPKTKYPSLDKVLYKIMMEVRVRKEYQIYNENDMQVILGSDVSITSATTTSSHNIHSSRDYTGDMKINAMNALKDTINNESSINTPNTSKDNFKAKSNSTAIIRRHGSNGQHKNDTNNSYPLRITSVPVVTTTNTTTTGIRNGNSAAAITSTSSSSSTILNNMNTDNSINNTNASQILPMTNTVAASRSPSPLKGVPVSIAQLKSYYHSILSNTTTTTTTSIVPITTISNGITHKNETNTTSSHHSNIMKPSVHTSLLPHQPLLGCNISISIWKRITPQLPTTSTYFKTLEDHQKETATLTEVHPFTSGITTATTTTSSTISNTGRSQNNVMNDGVSEVSVTNVDINMSQKSHTTDTSNSTTQSNIYDGYSPRNDSKNVLMNSNDKNYNKILPELPMLHSSQHGDNIRMNTHSSHNTTSHSVHSALKGHSLHMTSMELNWNEKDIKTDLGPKKVTTDTRLTPQNLLVIQKSHPASNLNSPYTHEFVKDVMMDNTVHPLNTTRSTLPSKDDSHDVVYNALYDLNHSVAVMNNSTSLRIMDEYGNSIDTDTSTISSSNNQMRSTNDISPHTNVISHMKHLPNNKGPLRESMNRLSHHSTPVSTTTTLNDTTYMSPSHSYSGNTLNYNASDSNYSNDNYIHVQSNPYRPQMSTDTSEIRNSANHSLRVITEPSSDSSLDEASSYNVSTTNNKSSSMLSPIMTSPIQPNRYRSNSISSIMTSLSTTTQKSSPIRNMSRHNSLRPTSSSLLSSSFLSSSSTGLLGALSPTRMDSHSSLLGDTNITLNTIISSTVPSSCTISSIMDMYPHSYNRQDIINITNMDTLKEIENMPLSQLQSNMMSSPYRNSTSDVTANGSYSPYTKTITKGSNLVDNSTTTTSSSLYKYDENFNRPDTYNIVTGNVSNYSPSSSLSTAGATMSISCGNFRYPSDPVMINTANSVSTNHIPSRKSSLSNTSSSSSSSNSSSNISLSAQTPDMLNDVNSHNDTYSTTIKSQQQLQHHQQQTQQQHISPSTSTFQLTVKRRQQAHQNTRKTNNNSTGNSNSTSNSNNTKKKKNALMIKSLLVTDKFSNHQHQIVHLPSPNIKYNNDYNPFKTATNTKSNSGVNSSSSITDNVMKQMDTSRSTNTTTNRSNNNSENTSISKSTGYKVVYNSKQNSHQRADRTIQNKDKPVISTTPAITTIATTMTVISSNMNENSGVQNAISSSSSSSGEKLNQSTSLPYINYPNHNSNNNSKDSSNQGEIIKGSVYTPLFHTSVKTATIDVTDASNNNMMTNNNINNSMNSYNYTTITTSTPLTTTTTTTTPRTEKMITTFQTQSSEQVYIDVDDMVLSPLPSSSSSSIHSTAANITTTGTGVTTITTTTTAASTTAISPRKSPKASSSSSKK